MAGVNVATLFVESSVTIPAGFTQGDAHESTKFVPVTASLNVALIIGLWTATLIVLLPGVVEVTTGASVALVLLPSISFLPPQLVIAIMSRNEIIHLNGVEYESNLFILFP